MVPDYVSAEAIAELNKGQEGTAQECTEQRHTRQKAWLARKRGADTQPAQWNPRKRHRKDTAMWLAQVDHQMVFSCGVGLGHFAVPEEVAQRGPWDTWPLLSYAGDQGSKEEAGKWTIRSKLRLNFDEVPDQAHGVWNDCKLALRRAGHWSHVGLMMLSWNMRHGPWAEDQRQHEIKACIANFLRTEEEGGSPRSPIFASLVHRMAFDAQDPALEHCEDLGAEMLRRFREQNPFEVKGGSKVNFNRFMSFLKAGWDEAPRWTFSYFCCLLVCLDQGYLDGARFKRLLVAADDELVRDRTTAASRRTTTESSLVKSAQNQVVVATMMLSDSSTQRRQRSIDIALEPHLAWFEQQAHELRSTMASRQWLQRQLQGEFLATLAVSLCNITKEMHLQYIGFAIPPRRGLAPKVYTSFEVEEEDWLAAGMADLVLHGAGARCCRCAWLLWGWSARSCLWIADDPQLVASEVAAFRKAHQEWEAFKANPGGHAGVRDVVQRNQFQWVCTEQLVAAMEEHNWGLPSDRLRAFIEKKHNRLLSSQIVEDAFGRQKGFKALHVNRRLRVAGIWDVLQRRELMTAVHSYSPLPATIVASTRGSRLPANAFEAPPKGTTVDLAGICSFRAQPTWHSTKAELHSLQFLDGALISFALEHNMVNRLKDTWLNVMIRAEHHILIRQILNEGCMGHPTIHGDLLARLGRLGLASCRISSPRHPGQEVLRACLMGRPQ